MVNLGLSKDAQAHKTGLENWQAWLNYNGSICLKMKSLCFLEKLLEILSKTKYQIKVVTQYTPLFLVASYNLPISAWWYQVWIKAITIGRSYRFYSSEEVLSIIWKVEKAKFLPFQNGKKFSSFLNIFLKRIFLLSEKRNEYEKFHSSIVHKNDLFLDLNVHYSSKKQPKTIFY